MKMETSVKNKNKKFSANAFLKINFCEGEEAEGLTHFAAAQNASNQISRIFLWAKSEVCQAYYARQDERFGLDAVRGNHWCRASGVGFEVGQLSGGVDSFLGNVL